MHNKNKFQSLASFIKAQLNEPEAVIRLIEESEDDILTTKVVAGQSAALHVVAKNPAYIKHIFFEKSHNYGINFRFKIIRSVWGGREIPTALKTWEQDRDILALRLNKEAIKEYVPIIVEKTSEQFETWKVFAEKNSVIDINKTVSALAMNNILNTIYGGVQIDIPDTISLLKDLLSFPPPVAVHPILRIVLLFLKFKRKNLQKRLQDTGWEIIRQSFTDNVTEHSMIKHLAKAYDYHALDQLDNQTKERLLSNAVTFLVGGTVAGPLLANAMIFLSLYPLVAENLTEEVKSVLGSRNPNYEDMQKLVYTHAVVRETLRLRTPTRNIFRTCLTDDVIEGHQIRKGDLIFVPIQVGNRLSKYWDNPEAFDPRRFLEPLTNDQKLLYMPFGFGSHSCLGSQFVQVHTVLILAMLAQRYKLTLLAGTPWKKGDENIMMKVSKI